MSSSENNQSSNQVSVDTMKQLYDTLLELRLSIKELEKAEITEALNKNFERLDNIIKALSDFVGQYQRTWYIRLSDQDEIEISHMYETDVATYIKGDYSWKIADVYEKFFNEKDFVNKIIRLMITTVEEITDLIKRNVDVYTRIAVLDGKIDQLYRDIRKLCSQQDP